jgi:hypothetical protein
MDLGILDVARRVPSMHVRFSRARVYVRHYLERESVEGPFLGETYRPTSKRSIRACKLSLVVMDRRRRESMHMAMTRRVQSVRLLVTSKYSNVVPTPHHNDAPSPHGLLIVLIINYCANNQCLRLAQENSTINRFTLAHSRQVQRWGCDSKWLEAASNFRLLRLYLLHILQGDIESRR